MGFYSLCSVEVEGVTLRFRSCPRFCKMSMLLFCWRPLENGLMPAWFTFRGRIVQRRKLMFVTPQNTVLDPPESFEPLRKPGLSLMIVSSLIFSLLKGSSTPMQKKNICIHTYPSHYQVSLSSNHIYHERVPKAIIKIPKIRWIL